MTADMSRIEALRAAQHEELCRQAATLVFIPERRCRFRQCWRRGVCSGAMVPSSHQARQMEVQRMLGLSGRACASLPVCVARLDGEQYQIFRRGMGELQQQFDEHREIYPWHIVKVAFARLHVRHLTSNPDHPTSDGDTGGDDP